ncbi:MAG: single-stranded-DNA-specific exonuclease RecJ [Candidatus Heteroscillospira sp.]|jgi:single-stranded-DNA-specific exonuclease
MKQKIKWNIPRGETAIPRELTDAGLNPLLAAMLCSRGITGAQEALAFIYGANCISLSEMDFTDLDKACDRIRLAVRNGEKCAVFGDYDVDGITSTCLMTDFLRNHMGLNCISYIPDRIEEGYGLNTAAVKSLAEQGVKLIVTVDCGITAMEETAYAKSLGVDMIITDHHECQEHLPDAAAVVDPKRDGSCHEGHALAGVGVAFRLACALSGDTQAMLKEYADLVAVGTVADVMPLTGFNRAVVKAGLRKLSDDPRPGIGALLHETGMDARRASATTVGFTLAPRLNAAGRLGCAWRAAELLMAADSDTAARLAAELCELNRSRQDMEHEIWNQAREMLKSHPAGRPIVLVAENWHQGVVGIVASRLAETYSLPTVMICLDGNRGKGSCRSCGSFNLFDALSACSPYLESFGGHALAAGLNISRENIPAFEQALADYYRDNPPAEPPSLELDLRIDDPEMLSIDCVRSLDMLEPCGNGNPRPRLCIVNARLDSIIPMGGGRHLRLGITKRGQRLECVFFSHTEKELGLKAGELVDIAFYPQINEYRSRVSVQLILTDIRPSDQQKLCSRLLQGYAPEYGEAGDILPGRRDFAACWRYLESLGGHLRCAQGEIDYVLHPLGLPSAVLCAVLRVFSEVGLLRLNIDGDKIEITQAHTRGKADLNAAPFMKTLSAAANTGGISYGNQ